MAVENLELEKTAYRKTVRKVECSPFNGQPDVQPEGAPERAYDIIEHYVTLPCLHCLVFVAFRTTGKISALRKTAIPPHLRFPSVSTNHRQNATKAKGGRPGGCKVDK